MLIDGGLRKIFRIWLPSVHWLTVETSSTEGGVPDLNGCHSSHEFWIECKVTAGRAVHIRPQQIGWMLRRERAGGRTFIAVRRHAAKGVRRLAVDELYLFSGTAAEAIQVDGLGGAVPVGLWPGGPARWCWNEIREVLIKPQ